MSSLVDMTGMVIGRLTVLRRGPNAGPYAAWECRCSCGAVVNICGRDMRAGSSKSCGCLQIEVTRNRATTHGHTKAKSPSPEYYSWGAMHSRCKSHPRYIRKGITVCKRWSSFDLFLADMGPRPSPEYSLDRYPDNDGGYSPDNCRWATPTEQQRNTDMNRIVNFNGREMPLVEAAEVAGLSYQSVWQRLHNGWSLDDALTIPRHGRVA